MKSMIMAREFSSAHAQGFRYGHSIATAVDGRVFVNARALNPRVLIPKWACGLALHRM